MSEYDPTNPEAQAETRKARAVKDKLAEQSELLDMKWLMESKRGRRILWRMLERAGVYRLSFNTNSMTMAFAEGARNEGLRLVALIHAAAPDLYPLMLKEARE